MDLNERHQKLLDAQNELQPRPTMTIREMGAAMNIKSTSYVRFILDQLVADGRAVKMRRGLKHVYRIVDHKQAPRDD